mgnify:CR=1 FL=1
MSVKSKMTAIADKLRKLLGITSLMGLDDMASNLDACQEEVDSQGELLDTALEIIAQKAAPGTTGLPGGISKIETGTITLNTDSVSTGFYEIKHNLGEMPNFYILCATSDNVNNDFGGYLFSTYCTRSTIGGLDTVGSVNSVTSSGDVSIYNVSFRAGTTNSLFSETSFYLYLSNRPLKAGVLYRWVCGVADGIE